MKVAKMIVGEIGIGECILLKSDQVIGMPNRCFEYLILLAS